MKLFELARKLFGLPDTATEDDVAKALETHHAASKTAKDAAEKVPALEAKLAEVETKLKAAEPLVSAGTSALADLKKSILDDDLAVTGKEANPELSGLVEMYLQSHEYAKLRALADQKAAARAAKFGKGLSGDPDAKGDPEDEKKAQTAEEIRLRIGR